MAHATPASAGHVLVLNPTGNGSTSNKHAKAYVRRGLADWVDRGRSIRFRRVATDYRERSAAISAAKASGLGYDRISRLLMPREVANIPVVQAWRLYGCGEPTARGGRSVAASLGAFPDQRWNGYGWEYE